MAVHPKTARLLTQWLTETAESQTDVPDFNALYEPGVLEDDNFLRNFPMVNVRRLILSHASSPDVLHVAQNAASGEFLAVTIASHDNDGRSVTESFEMEINQRYHR